MSDPISPLRKKTKLQQLTTNNKKENVPNKSKANRRTYFFGGGQMPTDNLSTKEMKNDEFAPPTNPKSKENLVLVTPQISSNSILSVTDPNILRNQQTNSVNPGLNLETPRKRTTKNKDLQNNIIDMQKRTPRNSQQRHQSSDDNIFWMATPSIKHQLTPTANTKLQQNYSGRNSDPDASMEMSDNNSNSNNNKSHNNRNGNSRNNQHTNNNNNNNSSANNSMSLADISMNSLNSVPSSPLKDNQQSTANALDPALKALIEKYNSTVVSESKTKNSLNTIERSVSDPYFLQGKRSFQELDKKSDSYGEGDSRSVPIIARKHTLNESFRDGFSKVQNANSNYGKVKSFNSLTSSNITNLHRDNASKDFKINNNHNNNISISGNNNSTTINENEIKSSTPFGDSGSNDIPQLLTMIANNLNKNNSEDDLSDISKDNLNILSKSNFTNGIGNNDHKSNTKDIVSIDQDDLENISKENNDIIIIDDDDDDEADDDDDDNDDEVSIVKELKTSNDLNLVGDSNNKNSKNIEIRLKNKNNYLPDSESEDGFSDDLDMEEIDGLTSTKNQNTDILKQPSSPIISIEVNKTDKVEVVHDDTIFSDEDEDELNAMFTSMSNNPVKSQQIQIKDMKLENNPQIFKDDNINLAKSSIKKQHFNRFVVKSCMITKYKKGSSMKEQKILKVLTCDDTTRNIVVRDQWSTLNFETGDVIHIVGEDSPHLVDSEKNVLIWNPDILLSATSIADAVDCPRKSILSSKLAFPGEHALALTVGTIVHSIFQKCLSENRIDKKFIDDAIDEELDYNDIAILSMGETKEKIKSIVLEHSIYIVDWIKLYSKPNNYKNAANHRNSFYASNILDVEENIWSPTFGMKGLIDVVIEACELNSNNPNKNPKYVVPMEIKTGREYISNRAQVSLYTLLVNERYDLDTEMMVLVYTKSRQTYYEKLKPNDLKLLINIRNVLSQYLKYGVRELPKLKKSDSCSRCPLVDSCMVFNKLMEDGTAEESGLPIEQYSAITSHLDDNENYKSFFNHWDDLLTKEETFMSKFKRDLWVLTAKEREKIGGGKAIGDLQIIEGFESGKVGKSKYVYTFKRDLLSNDSILFSQLTKHDRIILSDENGNFGLAFGFIINIKPDSIVISTDRRWTNSRIKLDNFDVKNNQVFRSVLKRTEGKNNQIISGANANVPNVESGHYSIVIDESIKKTKYRIDKDEMFHGLALARYNLLNLFLPDYGDARRRRLIVDDEAPKYSSRSFMQLSDYKLNHDFNEDQINALDKSLRAKDYNLILGMPGTGKTTVIAQLIRFLVLNNKTVLLASYTHSAVDNILIKLLKDDFKILRTGNPNSIHPLIRKYSVNSEESEYDIKTKEDFEEAFMEPPIVATTCLGIRDTVFSHRTFFDYCIIDEASQVSMPVCLGPLRFCEKFILVGDHYQLPPLILNPEAKNKGLDKSLFRILSERQPESVVELTYQYRMCSDIMLLSNKLCYEGRLKCGNEKIANQFLNIPFPNRLIELNENNNIDESNRWMDDIFDKDNKVIFINHDKVPAVETSNGDKIENRVEAKLIIQIIKSLILCGVNQNSIGIMAFYRAQLRLFYRSLSNYKDLEILTADQFQGRDKDCVIISLVRSNDRDAAGDLLKEWRRVNVAMTRAKSKLIIVGSKKLMSTVPQFEGFMTLINQKKWIIDLSEGDDQIYSNLLEFTGESIISSTGNTNNSTDISINKINTQSKVIKKTLVVKNVLDELK
ncbi:hypothetical protein B5S29_g2655 [[Candida] boidinii]|nr:hypothetical protein B5S29_g2655 [[Candida] boidinii]